MLHAYLNDETFIQTYKLCLKVSSSITSMTIPNLELDIVELDTVEVDIVELENNC